MKNVLAIALILLFSLAAPLPSLAQGSNKAAAEALFQQALTLFKADKYQAAAEKFDASQKLEPAIGTLLYLGDCYEKLDKKASAWASFKEAESLAQSRKDDRQKTAEVRAAALLPQVSHLVVRVGDESLALPGFTVRRDGVEMPPASLGAPLPVDAGVVALEATADGYESWSKTVKVPDGGKEITVDVPTLAKTATPMPTPVPDPIAVPDPDNGGDTGDGGASTAVLIAGIATGVVGLAGVAVGSAFGVMARETRDDSLVGCRSETLCPADKVELRMDAQDQALISTVTFVIGGVLVAAGVTLVVVSQTVLSEPAGEGAGGLKRLELAPTASGLMMRGAW